MSKLPPGRYVFRNVGISTRSIPCIVSYRTGNVAVLRNDNPGDSLDGTYWVIRSNCCTEGPRPSFYVIDPYVNPRDGNLCYIFRDYNSQDQVVSGNSGTISRSWAMESERHPPSQNHLFQATLA